jgi:shikimate kinase
MVLVGPRGAGKTTAAAALATALHGDWVDMDDLVQANLGDRTAGEVFGDPDLGERAWRAAECAVLETLLQDPPRVIAAGGGLVTTAKALDMLDAARARGEVRVLWLQVSPEAATQRLRRDAADRPALTPAGDVAAEAAALTLARAPLYAKVADAIVDADQAPDAVVRDLVAAC